MSTHKRLMALVSVFAVLGFGCGGATPAAPTSGVVTPAPETPAAEPTAVAEVSAAPAAPAEPAAARELWSVATPGQTASLIDVRDGKVYALAGQYMDFGSPTRHVLCLDAETGKTLWSHDAGEGFIGTGALVGTLVVLTSVEGDRMALDAATGKKAKKVPAEPPSPAPPPLTCNAASGYLACADAVSGASRWNVPVAEPVAAIAQSDSLVCYARAKVRKVDCVDAQTGKMRWSYAVPPQPDVKNPDEIHVTMRVVGDRLYVANYDGSVVAETAP